MTTRSYQAEIDQLTARNAELVQKVEQLKTSNNTLRQLVRETAKALLDMSKELERGANRG